MESPLLIAFIWEPRSTTQTMRCIGCRQIQWVNPDYRSTFDVYVKYQGQNIPVVDPSGEILNQHLARIPVDSCVLLFSYNQGLDVIGVLLHSLDDIHVLIGETSHCHQDTYGNLPFVLEMVEQHDPIAQVRSFLKCRDTRALSEDTALNPRAGGLCPV